MDKLDRLVPITFESILLKNLTQQLFKNLAFLEWKNSSQYKEYTRKYYEYINSQWVNHFEKFVEVWHATISQIPHPLSHTPASNDFKYDPYLFDNQWLSLYLSIEQVAQHFETLCNYSIGLCTSSDFHDIHHYKNWIYQTMINRNNYFYEEAEYIDLINIVDSYYLQHNLMIPYRFRIRMSNYSE